MTASTDHAFAARRAGDIRLIGGVSAAHFMSHYYMLVLPPLFAFVRQDYGVSYTELGLALTMFNAASAVLQTPAGFMVDRINARLLLIGGLVLQAAALAVAIPATFGYNIFANKLNRFDGALEGFGSEIIALMAREGRI